LSCFLSICASAGESTTEPASRCTDFTPPPAPFTLPRKLVAEAGLLAPAAGEPAAAFALTAAFAMRKAAVLALEEAVPRMRLGEVARTPPAVELPRMDADAAAATDGEETEARSRMVPAKLAWSCCCCWCCRKAACCCRDEGDSGAKGTGTYMGAACWASNTGLPITERSGEGEGNREHKEIHA
jgi:hypothetical protein